MSVVALSKSSSIGEPRRRGVPGVEFVLEPGRELVEATMMRRPNLSTEPGSADQARFSIEGLTPCCDGWGDAGWVEVAATVALGISVWMMVVLALTMAAAASGSCAGEHGQRAGGVAAAVA
jgi:hypothetical protein